MVEGPKESVFIKTDLIERQWKLSLAEWPGVPYMSRFYRSKFNMIFPFALLAAAACLLTGCLNSNVTRIYTPSGSSTGQDVVAYGDGMVLGGQDSTGITITSTINRVLGKTADNAGVASQTSKQIAVRANAFAGKTQQTFSASFTIPTAGTAKIDFQSGYEPCAHVVKDSGDANIYTSGVPIKFTVSGKSYTGKCFSDSSATSYTFTPDTYPTAAVTVPQGTAWTTVLPATAKGCWLISAGRNDDLSDASGTESNIAAMVAEATSYSTNGCYIVLGVVNSYLEPSGSTEYTQIQTLNTNLASSYGSNFIDVRQKLVSLYDPTNAIDVMNHNDDAPPFTLHAATITGTLTADMDSGTCSFSLGTDLGYGYIIRIGSEWIYIYAGTDGNYDCGRGYAGSTAASYSAGESYEVVDPWHLGHNASTPTSELSGYAEVGNMVVTLLNSKATK